MRRFITGLAALAFAAAGVVGLTPSAHASVPDWDLAPPTATFHHQLPKTPFDESQGAQAKALLTGAGYYYAGAFEGSISVTGISGKMRVSNPYVACNTGEHSIMELALQDHPGGSPDNAAEIGWQKSCGDTGPKLFATNWTGGTWNGCYTVPCTGWHHNAGNPLDIGSYITSDSALCVGSSTACVKTFKIEYRASTCGSTSTGTFYTYDGTDIGCFDSTQLPSTSYNVSQEYMEVYYGGATGVPCTDGGNGKFANSGPYSSLSPAVIQSVTYLGTATSPSLTFNTPTDTNAYTVVGNGSLGNRTFSVGGPGYNSTGGLPGNIGSC